MAADINKVTVAVTNTGALVIVLGTIALSKAVKLKKLAELGPDEAQNIKDRIASALTDSADTMQLVNDFRKKKGLPPLVAPE